MLFSDRHEAGLALARKLAPWRGRDCLVLAVPRGGVEVGAVVAGELGAELDLITARKIGAPFNPELAVGAVTPDGVAIFNGELLGRLGLAERELVGEVERERAEIGRRLAAYRGARPAPRVAGRPVIVTDDGIATGFTMKAALAAVRRQEPGELVLAVPVGPPEALDELAGEVDQLVYLATPEPFYAVGQFYVRFDQTPDERVIALLQENWDRGSPGQP